MRAEIRSCFAMPVVIATLPDAAQLNGGLRPVVLEREREDQGVQQSELGGWQSSRDAEAWGAPPAKPLLEAGREPATRATSDRAGQTVRIAWKTNARANVNRHNHGNELHTHPGAYWSGTCHVDDGGIGDDPSLGGEFAMQDPRGAAPAMYAPLPGFAVPGGRSAGASDQMVLFPSRLLHAVRPYRGEREWVSVAFNFGL